MNHSTTSLQELFRQKGYAWNTQLNLVGIRSSLTGDDTFNDLFVCTWLQPAISEDCPVLKLQQQLNQWFYLGRDGKPLTEDGKSGANTSFALAEYRKTVGKYRQRFWTITTDPGLYYQQHLLDPKGCAVLCPGQHVQCWMLGNHQGKADHPALVQHGGPVRVARDADKDGKAEVTKDVVSGYFGINCHHASKLTVLKQIGKWSAGCQVFPNHEHHEELLRICRHFSGLLKNRFTYTLILDTDL